MAATPEPYAPAVPFFAPTVRLLSDVDAGLSDAGDALEHAEARGDTEAVDALRFAQRGRWLSVAGNLARLRGACECRGGREDPPHADSDCIVSCCCDVLVRRNSLVMLCIKNPHRPGGNPGAN